MWEITDNNLTTDHIWKWIGLICFLSFFTRSFVRSIRFCAKRDSSTAKLRPTLSMTWSNWLSVNYKLRIRNAKLDSELSFLFSLRARAYRVVKMRFSTTTTKTTATAAKMMTWHRVGNWHHYRKRNQWKICHQYKMISVVLLLVISDCALSMRFF